MGTKTLLRVIDEIRAMTVEEYDALYTSAMEDVRRMDSAISDSYDYSDVRVGHSTVWVASGAISATLHSDDAVLCAPLDRFEGQVVRRDPGPDDFPDLLGMAA